jgi:hypothetical protein
VEIDDNISSTGFSLCGFHAVKSVHGAQLTALVLAFKLHTLKGPSENCEIRAPAAEAALVLQVICRG